MKDEMNKFNDDGVIEHKEVKQIEFPYNEKFFGWFANSDFWLAYSERFEKRVSEYFVDQSQLDNIFVDKKQTCEDAGKVPLRHALEDFAIDALCDGGDLADQFWYDHFKKIIEECVVRVTKEVQEELNKVDVGLVKDWFISSLTNDSMDKIDRANRKKYDRN